MRSEGIMMLDVIKGNAIPKMLGQAILDVDGECECGEPLEMDSTMRTIRCSSLSCVCKIRAEAVRALRFLGVTEAEVESLKSIISEEISENSKCGCEILLSERQEIKDVVSKYFEDEMLLSEILGLTGIELLTRSSRSVMNGYRSVSELYDDIEKNEVVTIIRKLHLEKAIVIADEIKSDIERCRGVLLSVERNLNVRVIASKAKKVAGKNSGNAEYIGVATDESADLVGEHTNNKLYGELVAAVSEKRVLKGLSALQRL